MEDNKNTNRQICGNIFINIKTIKNDNKVFTFHCAFCSTDCDQLQIFSEHLEEHLHYFEEHEMCPNLLSEPEEIKQRIHMHVFDDAYNRSINTATRSEVYEDPLETGKTENMCATEGFIPVKVKNECEDSDNEEVDEEDCNTNYIHEADVIIEDSPEYANKLYSYIFKDLSSDELSVDSNDEAFDEAHNESINTDTSSEFFKDHLKTEKDMCAKEEFVPIAVKNESELSANEEESCDTNKMAQENGTNYLQGEDLIIEESVENSDILYAYIFKDLSCDELSDDSNHAYFNSKHDVNTSSNNLKKRGRTIFIRILPSLIQLYKKYELLWQVDNIAFGIKEKINDVYTKIFEELKLEHDVNITLEDISFHINYINDLFSKDKNNELKCKMEEKLFVPECEYYAELSFLSNSQGPFLCLICNKMLLKYDSYCQHMAQHSGTQPFRCPSCEVTFKCYHTFLTHKKRHLGIYSFHCDICGKGYSLKNDLEWHKTSHTGDKPYLCQICGRGFRARHGYVNHIRRHEQRFRYECHICKRGFNLLHALNSHVKSHLNIRDIICEICGKGFVHKQSLRKHELIHGDVKKYKCNECGKAFFQACGLRSHRKNHHT
ncbi:zinc finger protein 571-like [Lucilia sericata]|uniref:zinc finger protein 571-like n=1 Tax=Lucilia sericata TaxID=13632 RepID=UPI0018A81518|nr:zinc finger protein 571-like [Lucilia sericata]XP_037818399.1 zinc finger protein 571-like [Lucilia sericata]